MTTEELEEYERRLLSPFEVAVEHIRQMLTENGFPMEAEDSLRMALTNLASAAGQIIKGNWVVAARHSAADGPLFSGPPK